MSRKSNRIREVVLLALAFVGLFSLTACGGGSSSGGISIVLANVPSSLTVNQTASLSADVLNDSGTGGVNWTCSPAGSCGSFNPANTASGGTTTYTAPATAGTVTITATAADKSSATQSATITISSGSANVSLNGQYAYLVTGTDGNGFYVAAGSITADGNGNITTGEQDFQDPATDTEGVSVTGTYTVGAGGQGSMTLSAGGNTETFSFVLGSSNTHGLIIEFDANATSSGTLDLQSSSAFDPSSINGGFSFTSSGEDISGGASNIFPAALGGVATITASGGSVSAGILDVNDGGTLSSAVTFTGTISGPDLNGRGQITLASQGLNFTYYAVQGEVLRLVEVDGTILSAGTAYGQGASPNFTNASLSGNYVFYDSASTSVFGVDVLGQFSANGSGVLTGFADTNDSGNSTAASISGSTYSITSGSTGRGTLTLPGTGSTTQDAGSLQIYMVDPTINLLDPTSATGGGGALILDIDAGAVGNGLIVAQSSGSVSGSYATNLQLFDINSGDEVDLVGPLAASSGSLTGNVDVNDDGTTEAAVSTTGSYSADSSNAGRYTGSIKYGNITINGTYYQSANNQLLFLDTDSGDLGLGFLQQ
jgi:hypothetical protein